MKNIFKKPLQTIKNNISVKKSLAIVLGTSMLVASFLMGMTYANRDKSENTQALDNRQEEQSDVNLQSEQGVDATSSATIANSNTNASIGTNPDGTVKNGTTTLSKQFTLATLASYNGLNGAKAYIAYDGKVYDVTSSPYFVNGVHKYDSSVKAGTDITVQMNQAPSSHTAKNYIATLPQVGVLVLVITNNNTPATTGASSSQTLPATTIAPVGDDEEDDD